MLIMTLRKVTLLIGVTLFALLFVQQILQSENDTLDDLKRLSDDDSKSTLPKKEELVEKDFTISSPLSHKQNPRINRHAKDIHSWIERLGHPMSNDDIISSSEAMLNKVAQLASSDSVIYYQLLSTFADLAHGEQRIYLRRILALGSTSQIKAAINELLYHHDLENRIDAIKLIFSLEDKSTQVQTLDTIFNLYLSEYEYAVLLNFLADEDQYELANLYQTPIHLIYQYSSDKNVKALALDVLLSNTTYRGVSIYKLLEEADEDNKEDVLKLLRNLVISKRSKLGNVSALVRLLVYMKEDPTETVENKMIISDILTSLVAE